MISRNLLSAFTDEITKVSSATKAQQAAKMSRRRILGLLGAGTAAGVVAEQGKDDLMSGRRERLQRAQAMGVHSLST
jgi:hypothetical protein